MKQKYSIRKDTKNYTLVDIQAEINEDVLLLSQIGYTDVTHNTYDCEINSRAVRRLGRCTRLAPNWYSISINSEYLKRAEPESIHNTIMHEVIHSVSGCMNHGAKWKKVADEVNANYQFTPISRTHNLKEDKDYDNYIKGRYKYAIECTQCHSKWNFFRKTKTYNACKSGRAHCSCGSRSFICTEL